MASWLTAAWMLLPAILSFMNMLGKAPSVPVWSGLAGAAIALLALYWMLRVQVYYLRYHLIDANPLPPWHPASNAGQGR